MEETMKSAMHLSVLKRKESLLHSRDSSFQKPTKMYLRATKNDSIYGHMKKVTTGDYLNYK
jgi:hypothetical protein